MHHIKTSLIALCSLSMIACCHQAPQEPNGIGTEACQMQVISAYAWVNHMPQPIVKNAKTPPRNRIIHVAAELNPEAGYAQLERNDSFTTPENLTLNLIAAEAPVQAEIGAKYSESFGKTPYKTVSIMCNGLQIYKIEEVAKVH